MRDNVRAYAYAEYEKRRTQNTHFQNERKRVGILIEDGNIFVNEYVECNYFREKMWNRSKPTRKPDSW